MKKKSQTRNILTCDMGRAWTRIIWRRMKVFKLLLIIASRKIRDIYSRKLLIGKTFFLFFKQLQEMWLWQKKTMGNCIKSVLYPLVLALLTLIQLFQDDRQAILSYSDKQYDSFEIHSNVLQGYSSMTTVFCGAFSLLLCHSLLPIM